MSQSDELPDTLTPNTPLISNNTSLLPDIWGRLVSTRAFLSSVELRNDSYMFGRKETCDIYVNSHNMARGLLKLTSKKHFIISRDYTLIPYIKDISKNGTFINGMLIGPESEAALCDGDLISIGCGNLEVYQFKDEPTSSVTESFDKKYKITRLLGRGAFGEVYLAVQKGSCQRFAVKRLQICTKDEHKIKNEIKIMENVNHPCVIKMLESIYCPRGYVYIVIDFMEGGDLQECVLKQNTLSNQIAKLYVYQIALAVKYLHSCGITHRDLKPENVLLASKAQITLVKITDFGLSKTVSDSCLMRTLCGTPLYVAPEILQSDGKKLFYTPLVDVWSLGCILYFTIFGRTPFQREDSEDDEDCLPTLFGRIKRGEFVIPDSDGNCDEEALGLILEMLVADPKKRINIEEVLSYRWFQDPTLEKTMTKLLN